jgi:hypothetical protein
MREKENEENEEKIWRKMSRMFGREEGRVFGGKENKI